MKPHLNCSKIIEKFNEKFFSMQEICINPRDKNPEIKRTPKTRGFFSWFFKSRSWSPGFRDFRNFALGIFPRSWNLGPDPGDFWIFEIFRSSPKLKIPIPNTRDRDSGSQKNPIPKPTLDFNCVNFQQKFSFQNTFVGQICS